MNEYTNYLTMLSTEFRRYLMENEQLADQIPENALIIFQTERENAFNEWHETLSLMNREPDPFWSRWTFFAEQHGVKL